MRGASKLCVNLLGPTKSSKPSGEVQAQGHGADLGAGWKVVVVTARQTWQVAGSRKARWQTGDSREHRKIRRLFADVRCGMERDL
eukprot:CAMPEP_0116862432 /NCGR_PEP_ID=MMETSP0418-20121206/23632_1 /TAXON_ID=1158023 /ORGANISM="Astrosyne radiata, Strain 13vi08-1A" /LENGTH=84 /DNA_ID=CAMNT_0004497279 /DNA_START=648 /DNA_END=902 /DNA_ORIENTATION=-